MRTNLVLAPLALALATGAANAATVLVTQLGDGAGTCPSAASCTLRAAIAAANANDRIEFDAALPYPATIALATAELVIDKNLTVAGPGASRLAVDAAAAQRVLRVAAGSVVVEALSLTGGEVRGSNGLSAGNDSGGSGQSGVPADGGCVRVVAGSALVLDRVALRDCLADGGDGGFGGSGITGGANAAARVGGTGGSGGAALGGAVSVFGTLTMTQSSIQGAVAQGGAGGRGGNGGTPTFGSGGAGGSGGDAGQARGGAIHVAAGGALVLRNSTLTGNTVASANAGAGGNGGQAGAGGSAGGAGAGGDAGSVFGGDVYVTAGAQLADIEFATLGPATLAAGQPGAAGTGGGAPPGAVALTQGEVVFAGAAPRVRSSVLAGNVATADCQGAITASGTNADSDSSCTGFTLHATFAALFGSVAPAVDDGRAGYTPLGDSALIDAAADCLDLAGASVAVDQRGRPRPVDGDRNGSALCDAGAVEFDRRIFANGFEG